MSAPTFASCAFARRTFPHSLAALVLAAALAHPAAAEAGTPRVLTLEDAVRLASERGPALASAQLDVTVADALARDAGRLPPARIELDAENWGAEGASLMETTAGLGWTLELGGDRRARKAGAAAAGDVARASRDLAGRDVRAIVSEAFIGAWTQQQRLALVREARADAALAIEAARERLRAGAAPTAEVARAECEAARIAAREAMAKADRDEATGALIAHWGAASAEFDSLALGEPEEAVPTDATSAGAHPDAVLAAAGERVAEAEERVAGARRVPDLDLSFGVRRLNDPGLTGYVASLAVPLGSGGRGEVAAAHARRERATLERATTARRLRAAADAAARRHDAALAAWRELSRTAVPKSEEALAQVRAGYRAGRYAYADLADARRTALETRDWLIESAAAVWRARAEMERYAGAVSATETEGTR